jgi:hypothetical protein
MIEMESVSLVAGGIITYRLMELGTSYFFRRMTKDDFVTRRECSQCAKQGDSTIIRLAAEVSTIKGILLVLAVNADIPTEQLAKLTQVGILDGREL